MHINTCTPHPSNGICPAAPVPAAHSQVPVAQDSPESAWDHFVASVPGGSLHQASVMGALRAATDACQVLRHVLRDPAGHIVGGAQVLIKRLPLDMGIGLVPRGPLLAPDHMERMPELLDGLGEACRRAGVALVFVQPSPEVAERFDFPGHGFTPSKLNMLPGATGLIDLTQSPDDLLMAMHAKTRSNIRQGLKRGLVVRPGGYEDLPVFYDLLLATSQRQEFTASSLESFQTMWRLLAPGGHIHLLLAEAEGVPVSGLLMHRFADTATTKRVGWNGEARNMHPNKVLYYQAMLYAKELGCTVFDMDDIWPEDARKVLNAAPGETPDVHPVNQFKLLLGPRVVMLPGPMAMPPRTLKGRVLKILLPVVQDPRVTRWARRLLLGRAKG